MARGPLTKVRRLRQTDEVWESSVRRMRTWITPRNQTPYRPYVVLTVSQTGKIIGSDIVDDVPSPDQVLNTVAKAMRRPTLGAGRKRRPAIIYVDDEALVEALAPKLQEVGVRCKYRHTLREIDEALLSMEQFMTKQEPIPGLLKSPGVTPFLVNGLFEAAAFFYRQAPWRWIDDSRPIEVRYPPDGRQRYAIVMGHGGETYGLAVYDSPNDLRELYAGTPPEQLLGKQKWTSLLFVEAIETPFDDLDDMEKYNWPVAGELAYPFPVRVTHSGQFVRPGKSKLLWFEAALLAIPTFVREYMQADVDRGLVRPAEATLTVKMADGKDTIYLRYPVPGFEIPFEEDWAAIEEEEEEKRAEAAHERNAELLRAFEQWLTGKGLSKKTVQRHLDNVTFFADGYMAGDGGCVELPRPADQADTVDVDEFLTEWFMREAAWVSVGTVKANIASLKKFYACLEETGQMETKEAGEILELLRVDRDYYLEMARDYEEREFYE
jgi:hypothetical protein